VPKPNQRLIAILAAVVAALPVVGQSTTRAQPNIVLVLVDDLGWRDLGRYGSELHRTPHLDALAARGMAFSNAYSASPLCSPTRAAILTGQTVGRLRLTTPAAHTPKVVLNPKEAASASPGLPMTNPGTRTRLPLESVTISQLLKNAGYRTAFYGKWHLGAPPYQPEAFGFDVVVGGRSYPGPPESRYFGPWAARNNMPEVTGHPNADDVIGDEAVKFIAQPDTRPFFMAFWSFNVHGPFEGKPDQIAEFAKVAGDRGHQRSAIMGSMVQTLDDQIGKLVAEIRRRGLENNTLFILTSDNGGNMYDRSDGENPTSNHPLRAGKGNSHDGGLRVPLIVVWPGLVPPGTTNDTVTISYDFLPTLLEVARLPAPANHPLDGVSLMPALRGELMQRPAIYSMFGHPILATGNRPNVWMREGRWKLIRYFHDGPDQTHRHELYDLETDPGETENLAPTHRQVADRMSAELDAHLVETATLLPRKNPAYRPDFNQGGFILHRGGYFMGGPSHDTANVLAAGAGLTLRYPVPAGTSGTHLRVSIQTNCAIGATAGPGLSPVYGRSIRLIPDGSAHIVDLPLGRNVTGDVVTVLIDQAQPGQVRLTNPSLVTP
jgi:arylsulfatase A-like enzyme